MAYREKAETAQATLDVAAPVREVTVLEDRALCTRRGSVELGAGRARLVIRDVSPVLLDKSLLVELVPPKGGAEARVADARVVRERVRGADAAPADLTRLDEDVEAAAARHAALADERWRMSLEAEGLAQLGAAYLSELAEDASRGAALADARQAEAQRAHWGETAARERAVRRELAARGVAEEEAKRELARARERRAAADKPSGRQSARIEITVEADAAVAGATLVVRYVVANVAWRPRHRATLAGERVEIVARGTVWQNTGESWEGVRLSLSTERPSLGASPPKLATEWLTAMRKGPLVIETREQTIEQAEVEGGRNLVQDLPRIDDGGEARVLVAERAVSVPSDGRPHSVDLFRFWAKAESSLVAYPELGLVAHVRVVSVHAGAQPLLPGPVELVRGGGAVGRGSIGFVAPGEKLVLGFGPDPAIAITREVEQVEDQSSLLGSWQTKTHDVVLKLSNLGPEPKQLRVEERVLVSEIEKVQVATVAEKTTGGAKPDENGFVRWPVELGPFARETLRLRVVTRRHADAIG